MYKHIQAMELIYCSIHKYAKKIKQLIPLLVKAF